MLTTSLTLAAGFTMAPTAGAVGLSACRYDSFDVDFKVKTNGAQLRNGPGKRYKSHGTLYKGDSFRYFCRTWAGSGPDGFDRSWSYGRILKKTKSGIPKGTRGWVYGRYLD
ncbi:SH3 domain-containing protein [Streptomyces sp. P1-3]|uniref:SH3 domain-containing protein n=1 Tax=Streptomyces sp. P1-3 TaxID=3421658 RepID=UPI003D35DC50